MSYPWLALRIAEEQDRRQREAFVRQRLPVAFESLNSALSACVEAYANAFGPKSVEIAKESAGVKISICDEHDGQWRPRAEIDIRLDAAVPGFRIARGEEKFAIQVGTLPGEKLFYKREDQYLSIEDLTRTILDRSFFPKLA